MKKVKVWLLGGLLLAAVTAAIAAANDWTEEGKRWWSHVQYLADDKLEGRLTGSEGHRKAAQYVADWFAKYGLKPTGTDGYFQPVQFNVREIDEDHSSLALVRDGKVELLQLGEDAMFSLRSDLAESVEAPAVFVGYGLAVPEAQYDDLAGMDLRGKIAVYLAGGPASISAPLKAHYQSLTERWKALEKAGGIGMAVIQNPASMDIPWARQALSRFQPQMELADPELVAARGVQLSFLINPARADRFFAGTGHTLAEILAAATAEKPLPKFPLAVSFRAKTAIKKSQVESQNIVAVLPGSDPNLKNEYVALTAHIDHLGIGQPIKGDKIYNGAMDNASGVASWLEIARQLSEAKTPLKRSLLFVIVTGEEKGLLGSYYFASHPTVDARAIIADINIDMFLPIYPLQMMEVPGLNESTLGQGIRTVAEKAGVPLQTDLEPNRNIFIRSDQYSFIRKGIPALALKFGFEKGSPEERLHKEWLTNRYHAPSDDANQPVDLVAAAQFNRIARELAVQVANQPERPLWNKESFFRRFAQ